MEQKTESPGNLQALVIELTRQIESMKAVKLPQVETATVIAELIAAKTRANRRQIYIASLRHYIKRFAVKFPELTAITSDDVEGWIAQFKSDYSRQTWLTRISTLFSFAVRRGYVPKNPCDKLDRITIDRNAPSILTVKQSRDLLATVPLRIKPYLILGMFAGIRPDEIMRMQWQDVNLETKTVKVDGKTRRRRVVPLEPIAVELLRACPQSLGSVAPSRSTLRRWKGIAGRTLPGGRWRPDILRHTAASYLVAKYEDPGKVAFWLGNSAQILMQHYHEPVTRIECENFWSLLNLEAVTN